MTMNKDYSNKLPEFQFKSKQQYYIAPRQQLFDLLENTFHHRRQGSKYIYNKKETIH